MTLIDWKRTTRYPARCHSLGFVWCFSREWTGVVNSWEESHRGGVIFSLQNSKSTYYQHDFSLLMLPLITRQRVLILFLHWVLTLCPFAHRTLWASHSVQFMLQECYVPAPRGQRGHINNLEFFCIGGFLFISHFFIYSFMCGVMDFFMYFWIFMPSIPGTESRTPIKSCTVETLCGPPLHLVSLATSTWLAQVAIRAQSPGESLKYMYFVFV